MNKINLDMELIEIYFSAIESLLFVHGDPISLKEMSSILDEDIQVVEKLMEEFENLYNRPNRGIKVFKIDDKYQLGTKP